METPPDGRRSRPYVPATFAVLVLAFGVGFWYFGSLGGVSTGTMTEIDGRLRFVESYGDDPQTATLRGWIVLPDADHFTMVSERLVAPVWVPVEPTDEP